MTLLDEAQKQALCLRCLYCCKYVYIPLESGVDCIAFYRDIRGLDIKFHNFQPWVILYAPCQHLTDAGCSIYATRPWHCKMFDGRTDFFVYSEKCLWNTLNKW